MDHLIKTLAAEVQLYVFKVMGRTVADMMVKAEVFLVIPKVKGFAAHIANLCRVIRQHNFIHFSYAHLTIC
jgi:hypothetical protein